MKNIIGRNNLYTSNVKIKPPKRKLRQIFFFLSSLIKKNKQLFEHNPNKSDDDVTGGEFFFLAHYVRPNDWEKTTTEYYII